MDIRHLFLCYKRAGVAEISLLHIQNQNSIDVSMPNVCLFVCLLFGPRVPAQLQILGVVIVSWET